VVLSGQRVDLKDAIYNASKQKERAKEEAANPLVLNGQKLIPSVTRVFSKSRSESGIWEVRDITLHASVR